MQWGSADPETSGLVDDCRVMNPKILSGEEGEGFVTEFEPASAPSPRVSWAHPVEGPIDSDRASTSDESGLAGDLFDVERVHPATPETTRCVRVQFQPPD